MNAENTELIPIVGANRLWYTIPKNLIGDFVNLLTGGRHLREKLVDIYKPSLAGSFNQAMKIIRESKFIQRPAIPGGIIPAKAIQDNDGHWYVIPALLESEFDRLLDGGEETEDEFIEIFSDYMTGGALNNTQLYAKFTDSEDAGGYVAGSQYECLHIHFSEPEKIKVDPSVIDADVYAFGICYIEKDEQGNERRIDPLKLIRHEQKEPKKPGALEMVEEFHRAFNCPVLKTPTIPDVPFGYAFVMDHIEEIKGIFNRSKRDNSRSFLRIKLIFEEFTELAEAISTHNMIEILDALCDLMYVVYGTAPEFGLGPVLKEAFREVHRSNMSKLNGDGKPIVRNDGKVLKGPNFTPPDLAGILLRYSTTEYTTKYKSTMGSIREVLKDTPASTINGAVDIDVSEIQLALITRAMPEQ